MGSEVDEGPMPMHRDTLDASTRDLEQNIETLRNQAQHLMSDKVLLEGQIADLRKRITRLDDDIRMLKSPPLVVGQVQDVIDPTKAVVRSSNGTVFLVHINPKIDAGKLTPGARVSLHQDTLSIVDVLDAGRDPLVTGAEMSEQPRITFADLGGVDEQIELLTEALVWPLTRSEDFKKIGIEPPKGVLLVGPPGCGKTMMAKALASFAQATFIRLVGSELAQKYIGEGGRLVRELFDLARTKAPSIVFIDEIDAIGARRLDSTTSGDREVQRTLMQLLAELDGFEQLEDVKIIAATNRPDILDDALLRPGRFDRVIEIPLPNIEARNSILKIHFKSIRTYKIDIKRWVNKTEGFSGADLKALTTEAGMVALREGKRRVTENHMSKAFKLIDKQRKEAASIAAQAFWA